MSAHNLPPLSLRSTINPANRNEFFILWTIIRSEERTTGWKQQSQICWTRVAPSRLSRRHNSKLVARSPAFRIQNNFRNLYNRLITNSSMSAHNQMGRRQRLSITPAAEKSIRNNEATTVPCNAARYIQSTFYLLFIVLWNHKTVERRGEMGWVGITLRQSIATVRATTSK